MKFIIGYKQAMTQQYREDGTIVPVTIVKADPVVVTQVKTADKEGYTAVQVGVGTKKAMNRSQLKPLQKILDTGRKPFHRMRELRVEDASKFKVGDMIQVSAFGPGDKVQVIGVSKGKGFQGVVKRHGFAGSPASHGHKDQLRMPGSAGAGGVQHTWKGQRGPGRTGGKQITVKNLEIVQVDQDNGLVYVKGALPGSRNSMVVIAGDGEFADLSSIFEQAPVEQTPEAEVKAEAKEEPKAEAQEEIAPAEEAAPAEEKKEEPAQ